MLRMSARIVKSDSVGSSSDNLFPEIAVSRLTTPSSATAEAGAAHARAQAAGGEGGGKHGL
jgi:hypothetical protein